MAMTRQVSIFLQLVRREWRVFKSELFDSTVSTVIVCGFNLLLINVFLPAFGVPHDILLSLIIGKAAGLSFFIGFSRGIAYVFDLENGRSMFAYFAQLPLSPLLVIFAQITSMLMALFLIVWPAMMFSLWYTAPAGISAVTYLFVTLHLLLGALFLSTFFSLLSFARSSSWYLEDAWPRLLMPLYGFGAFNFGWGAIWQASPKIALIMLLNPLTHYTDGFRALVEPESHIIPYGAHFCALVIAWLIMLYGTYYYACHRLNLVTITQREERV